MLHDKHFEADQKIILEMVNQLPHFVTRSIDHYDKMKRVKEFIFFSLVLFTEKPAFDLLIFCSLQRDSA